MTPRIVSDQPARIPLRWVIGLGLVWVIGTLAYGWWTTQTIPVPDPTPYTRNPAGPFLSTIWQPTAPLAALSEPWRRFDVVWYLGMAQAGYAAPAFTAFAPLYPIAVALANAVTFGLLADNLVLLGMIISTACAGLVLVLLYRLTLAQLGSQIPARRVIVLLIAFPTAFYLLIPYAESLYLLLALLTVWAGQRRRWWIAGLCAALAVLTRFHGAVLIVPLAWLAFDAVRTAEPGERGRTALRTLPAVIAAPLGLLLVQGFIAWQGGGTTAAFAAEWNSRFALPHVSALAYIERLLNGTALWHEHETVALIALFGGLCAIALVQAVRGRLRPEYALYALATFGLSLNLHYDGAQYHSVMRHVLLLFPCFIVLAGLLQSRWLFGITVAGALVWQALLILRFTHWIWVA